MSDLSRFLDGSGSETQTTNDADTFAPNATTGWYYTLGDTAAAVAAALKAAGYEQTTNPDEDAHVMVRYWAALHAVKGAYGKRQKDHNPFALSTTNDAGDTYLDTFGPSGFPTVETETLNAAERRALEGEGVDVDELGASDEVHIPVLKGRGRLPVVVNDEDELADALEMLEATPDEPAAMGVPDESQDADDNEDGPEGVECEHCGDTFDPRGISSHQAACDGESTDEQDETDDSEADDGENDGYSLSDDERDTVMALLADDDECPTFEDAADKAERLGLI